MHTILAAYLPPRHGRRRVVRRLLCGNSGTSRLPLLLLCLLRLHYVINYGSKLAKYIFTVPLYVVNLYKSIPMPLCKLVFIEYLKFRRK